MMRLLFLACALLLALSPASAQTTYYPARGIWNGFLNQINIVECDNINNRPVHLTLQIVTSDGAEIGLHSALVPAFGSAHTILNDLTSITDNFGIYVLSLGAGEERLGDGLHCRTVFYRPARAGALKQFDYAYSLAVQNPQSGTLSGVYNSFDPSAGDNVSQNWLSVVNFDRAPFNAVVHVYDAGGALHHDVPVPALAPGARLDIPLGHPRGQTTGLYVIEATDPSQRYDAVVVRYNVTPSGEYNFAFPLRGTGGSCTGQPVLASSMGNGLTKNWLEIANANPREIAVTVEVRDGTGALVHAERPVVPALGQYHVYLSDKIDPAGIGNVGSARVLCDDPTDKLIVQSTFYGAVPGSFPVEWAYSTQELGRSPVGANATITAPVNTFVGMANWFKFADASLEPTLLSYSLFDQAGQTTAQGEQWIPAGGTADIGVHSLTQPDRVGSIVASSANGHAKYSGEMLRVLSRGDGQIGTIISIPGIVAQNGAGGGSFRGDPQSLARYRDKLTFAEASRLLTVAAFGGSRAETERAVRDGLQATVERLSTVVTEPRSVRREAEDWLDNRFQEVDEFNPYNHTGIKRWWLTYLMKSPNALRERLAVFWHDRFAASCRVLNGGLMMQKCYEHMSRFRRHAMGSYRSLLREMTTDFLMLKWLNGEFNVRQSPDENYAREVMELFSLGETQQYGAGLRYPLYTQTGEIPQFARALTGYTTQFVNDQFGQQYVVSFVVDRHDDGVKTVWPGSPYELSGRFEPLDVPDVILNQRPREVGRYIGGALFTYFCHDHPSEALRAQMADILISSNWEVKRLVQRILTSEACFSYDAYKSRLMDPLTFAIGFLKKTGIPMRVDRVQSALSSMGYDITNPVDVFGWPMGTREKEHHETTFWSAYTVEYANFITSALTSHKSDFRDEDTNLPLFDLCGLNPGADARSSDVVAHIAELLGAQLSRGERQLFTRYLDNSFGGYTSDGEVIENPQLFDPRVPNICETKLGGLLWMTSLHPDALTY